MTGLSEQGARSLERAGLTEHFAAGLTDKELEAVQLVFATGQGIRRASRQLGISPQATRDRLEAVRRKLGAARRGPESDRYRTTGLTELDHWIRDRDARDVKVDDDDGRDPCDPRLPGDPTRLRGIPVIGRGIGGASPGTRPG